MYVCISEGCSRNMIIVVTVHDSKLRSNLDFIKVLSQCFKGPLTCFLFLLTSVSKF